jgi:hypothetical protein
MTASQQNKDQEPPKVVPHPTLLRQQILKSPSKANIEEVLYAIDAFRKSGWSLKEIQTALAAGNWKPAIKDIDALAAYLARFDVTYCGPPSEDGRSW